MFFFPIFFETHWLTGKTNFSIIFEKYEAPRSCVVKIIRSWNIEYFIHNT